MHVITLALTCLLVLSGVPRLAAQSLADVARKEEGRRQAIKQPSKVFTNKDLGSVPATDSAPPPKTPNADASAVAGQAPSGQAQAGQAQPGQGQAGQAPAGAAGDKAPAKTGAEPIKDQAYWAGRQKALTVQLDQDQALADALQSRVDALTTDFVNRDNPVQRAGIERDRQKALVESVRLKTAIQQDKKALADLQEEARRAGVPPGWLR
jgi:hypothetical protein